MYIKKYFLYKSDKPNKKCYIITNDNKKVYFGAAGYSDFTIHKDEERKLRYAHDLLLLKVLTGASLKPQLDTTATCCMPSAVT